MARKDMHRAYAEMIKGGRYRQTYEVVIPIPDHPLPHRTSKEFPTEEQAKVWIESAEGQDLIERIRAKYRKQPLHRDD